MNEVSVGLVLGLAFFAWKATPHVWWSRGWFRLESAQSMRWPPDAEPPEIKPGYELDASATRFICLADSVVLIVLAQQVWFPIGLWTYAALIFIAAARTLWSLNLISADGGFGRTRNAMESMLLWAPFGSIVVLDLVIALSAPIHIGRLLT